MNDGSSGQFSIFRRQNHPGCGHGLQGPRPNLRRTAGRVSASSTAKSWSVFVPSSRPAKRPSSLPSSTSILVKSSAIFPYYKAQTMIWQRYCPPFLPALVIEGFENLPTFSNSSSSMDKSTSWPSLSLQSSAPQLPLLGLHKEAGLRIAPLQSLQLPTERTHAPGLLHLLT